MKKYIKVMAAAQLATVLLTGSVQAAGEVGLPYIGTKSKTCNVSPISNPLDGGHLTDEGCNVIFVKPPKLGISRLTAYSGSNNIHKCGLINEIQEGQLFDLQMAQSLAKKRNYLKKQLKDSPEDQHEYLMSEIKKSKKRFLFVNEGIEDMQPTIDEYNSRYGATVMITLENHWNVIRDAYKKANPNMAVKRVPIISGHLTYEMKRPSAFDVELNVDPVIKTRDTLLKVSYPGKKTATEESVDFTDQIDSNEQRSFHFGNSANISIDLSLLGLCPYTTIESPLQIEGSQSPVAFLSPNFTYFYPVASKSIYKVSINPLGLSDVIIGLKKQGNIKAIELAQALGTSSALVFDEGTSSDVFNNRDVSAVDKKTAKEFLVTYITETVLKSIGTLVDTLKLSAEYQNSRLESRNGRSCKKVLFWKRCHNYTYSVTVTSPNWGKIAKAIENKLNNTRSSQVSSQHTYEFSGVMAFVPPQEIEKIKAAPIASERKIEVVEL